MLCYLYNEQLNWNSIECMKEIVYFLHLFYTYWPQFQVIFFFSSNIFILIIFIKKCYVNECISECQIFDHILTKLEQKCHDNVLQ